ncbi:phosphopantetheine-binding protein [Streptomyces sp. NPDC002533]
MGAARPGGGRDGAGRPPKDDEESLVCAVFAELLELGEVGADDNFFELGGHSMLLVRLREALREATGAELKISPLKGRTLSKRCSVHFPTIREWQRYSSNSRRPSGP